MTNKEHFKAVLGLIEIELFSYCNRKCWFCPNSTIDRLSTNIVMEESDYLDILSQLKQIRFSKEVTFSRYNEPLSKRELFIKRLSQARDYLPNAILRTNTNGDFVTKDYIHELYNNGLNQLWIQQYLSNNEKFNYKKLKKIINKKIKKLNLDYTVITDIPDVKIEYNIHYKDMTIHIRSRNFDVDGSSRGDVVPIAKDYQRTKKCNQPWNNMYIDYNGNIMVCCALRSDVSQHYNGIMGHIKDGYLWDIYMNDKYKPWRVHHSSDGIKKGVCKTCRDGIFK